MRLELDQHQVTVGGLITGGLEGVERGALEAAKARDIPIGGYVPEDFLPPELGTLWPVEAPALWRVEANVTEADAVLVLRLKDADASHTARFAARHRKPFKSVRLDVPEAVAQVRAWLREALPNILLVAGSTEPETQELARDFLLKVLE